jgi:hypothetical protein
VTVARPDAEENPPGGVRPYPHDRDVPQIRLVEEVLNCLRRWRFLSCNFMDLTAEPCCDAAYLLT